MPLSRSDDLIAEAREPLRHTGDDHCGVCYGSCGAWPGERVGDTEDLIARLADALEAVIANRDEFRAAWNVLGFEIDRLEAERDAALAVIENVRECLEENEDREARTHRVLQAEGGDR